MLALIFLWTPPHFWALALFIRPITTTAGVPMLTVTHGRAETRRQICLFGGAGRDRPGAGAVAGWRAAVSGGRVLGQCAVPARGLGGARRDDATAEADGYAAEKRLFRLSLGYLFWHFRP
jgi:protoheme IX farnesyltransferase